MKKRYQLIFCFIFTSLPIFSSLSFAQSFNWVKQGGGISYDSGVSISIDAYENSYVTGYFYETATFGTIQLVSYGGNDIFIAKYDATGDCIWAKSAGGSSSDYGFGISTDANGNSYVTGNFYETATFGTIQLVGTGDHDIFIAKFDASGNCLWAKSVGGNQWDSGNDIVTDVNGNSYVTGYFKGTVAFGTTQLVSNGEIDVFITKYDTDGNCLWAKSAGGISSEAGNSISIDGNGDAYVTGHFTGTATFGTIQLVSYGGNDIFIAKYDTTGNCIWARKAGGYSSDYGSSISTDANGNSYVTGNFYETATFGTIQLVSYGGNDIFIAKYDASGNCLWAENAGGTSSDWGRGISTDANGNSYVTGYFEGSGTFGTTQLVSYGGGDIFISKYDIDGNCIWAKQAGGNSDDYSYGISTDENGNPYVTGYFYGTATFGTIQLISYGEGDVFIAMFSLSPLSYDRIEFYTNVGVHNGNPNNYLTPGYNIRFRLRIKNYLSTNVLTAYGTIRCLTSGISVTDSQATYNNVLSGQEAWSVDDYEIYVPNTVPFGSQIGFSLSVTQSIPPTGPWESVFSFPIAPLRVGQIYLDDDQNPDSWGNNNKVPEPGETIEVIPLLKNTSSQTIYSATGRLSTDLSGIAVWDSVMGVSGMVYDTWRYNLISGIPQPIPTGSIGIQPEQDYVFDYANITPYPLLPFDLYYNAYVGGNPGGSWQTGGILIKWENPFYMADGVVSSFDEEVISDFIPSETQLHQNFPNPFNPVTSIQYAVSSRQFVTLKVYDILGNEVATLVNEEKQPGTYEVIFDGKQLPSGIYFYQLKAGNYIETKKMLLLK